MGRRATLSVLLVTLITVKLTSFEDVNERHEGRCHWICKITGLKFGEELKNLKGQGTIKAEVQYNQNRVNNSTDIFTEVWMTLWTDHVKPGLQSYGFAQVVRSKTLMQIGLSGQFISWGYRKLEIACIKRASNLFLNYSWDLNDSACARHQRPMLNLQARDCSNYTNLISLSGYLWTDKNSRIFVGFEHEQHSEKCPWHSFSDCVFYWLICIVFILYNPAILVLFCTTRITFQPETKSSQSEAPLLRGDETSHDSFMGRQDSTNEGENENLGKDTLLNDADREEDRKTVHLINIQGLNPIGFRSLIADNVFSNTGNHSKCRKWVKLALLVLFPLSIPILGDLFFLTMPKIFSRIAPHLPSDFLTYSVFHFAYQKSKYMLILFFFYFVRCLCLCFTPTTSIWVPSFVCRKHLMCAIYNNYCVQHILMCFPQSNTLSACDECKTTADCPKQCEVPENIQHNLQVQRQLFGRHRSYIYRHLFDKSRGEQNKLTFWLVVRFIFSLPVIVILFMLYVLIVLIDFMFSTPLISLCYGRIWVTGEWLEHKFQLRYRFFRFVVCHCSEFLLICCSVAWVTYFSFCTALVMEIALRGFEKTLVSYPVETLKYMTIIAAFLHSSSSSYRSLVGKYDELKLNLFKSYKESYKKHDLNDKLINYRQGDILTIPKDLFDKAYEKHMPLNVTELICKTMSLIVSWLFIFAFFKQIEMTTVGLTNYVLTALCTFVSWAHPWIINYFTKKKKTEEVILEEVAANVVEDYITHLTRDLAS